MKEVVRVWIGEPYKEGQFNGTAFFIDTHTLVTARHVVTNREGKVYENIFLGDTPDGSIVPVDEVQLCKRDLAILTVKKSFKVEPKLFTDAIEEGSDVLVVGFYDHNSSQKIYENRVSGYQGFEHTYELQNHLTHGLSGSPVFLNKKICGVAKAINIQKNLTYLIPIGELCMETERFFKEKAPKRKRLTLEQWASITGIVGTLIAIVAWVQPSLFEPTSVEPDKPPVQVEIPLTAYLLEGRVRDEENNSLVDVEVWEGSSGNTVETDREGKYLFKIEGKELESVEVKFNKEGYHDLEKEQRLGVKHEVLLRQKVD